MIKESFDLHEYLRCFKSPNDRIGASGAKSSGGVSNWVRGNMFILTLALVGSGLQ